MGGYRRYRRDRHVSARREADPSPRRQSLKQIQAAVEQLNLSARRDFEAKSCLVC